MARDDNPRHPFMTPEIVTAQDDFMRRCVNEMRVLQTERPVPYEAIALTGFTLFCSGCMRAGVDPTKTFRELVDHG